MRYYKTAVCIHDTDLKGACFKNGLHCAFAHGQADVRQPIIDILELNMIHQQKFISQQTIQSNGKKFNKK